jgi:hypothetical protein
MTLLFDRDRDGLHEPTWGDRASAAKYIARTLIQRKVTHDIKEVHGFAKAEESFLQLVFGDAQTAKDFFDRHKGLLNPSCLKNQTIELSLSQTRALLQQYGISKCGQVTTEQALVKEIEDMTAPQAPDTERNPLTPASALFAKATYGTSCDKPTPETSGSSSALPAPYDKVEAETIPPPSNSCCCLL